MKSSKFDRATMRLSVRMADHSSTYCASIWTRSNVSHGGPALLATGKGASRREARTKALLALSAVPS